MKAVFKKAIKIILITAITLLLTLSGIVYYYYHRYSTAWETSIPEQTFKTVLDSINSAPKLDEEFLKVYDAIYSGRNYSIFRHFLNTVSIEFIYDRDYSKNNYGYCFPRMAARQIINEPWYDHYDKNYRFNELVLAFGIEENVDNDKCFAYSFTSIYNALNEIRLNDIPLSRGLRNPTELHSRYEIVEFLAIWENPRLSDDSVQLKFEVDKMLQMIYQNSMEISTD